MTYEPMDARRDDVEKVAKALKFFVVAAMAEGIALLILVVEMVLKYGFENDALHWWPFVHGWIYMVFAIATVALGFAAKWSLVKIALVLCSGLVPVLSFWAERKVSAATRAQLAGWGAADAQV